MKQNISVFYFQPAFYTISVFEDGYFLFRSIFLFRVNNIHSFSISSCVLFSRPSEVFIILTQNVMSCLMYQLFVDPGHYSQHFIIIFHNI